MPEPKPVELPADLAAAEKLLADCGYDPAEFARRVREALERKRAAAEKE